MATQPIDISAHQRALALRDLTDAAHGPHAMQLLINDATATLSRAWQCPTVIHRASPVVAIADNYDRLHYAQEGAARDARYTRYLSPTTLLRTQTSAMVPDALRLIGAARYDDVLLACPGLTYRRDSIDRLHTGEPHQLDLWRIRRGKLRSEDLKEMIELTVAAMLPGCSIQLERATHPYTLEGLEIRVRSTENSIEIGECGLALPSLLDEAGLDSSEYSALAMGIGLDRVLMLRKNIDDIRLLRSADVRVSAQMTTLEAYQPVSSQPPMRRDLSIAVDADLTPEELGDRVRDSLEAEASCIEAIEVASEHSYYSLSLAARRRLGIEPHQKNVLLRVTLRHLERTLTSDEANQLRDRIYAALHQGGAHQWAGRPMNL